jgi:outer membrane protein W
VILHPQFGASVFSGPWSTNIKNQYSFGLATEFPLSRLVSLEVEGQYNNYAIAYTSLAGPMVYHKFNQYVLGGNTKFYFSKSIFRPYMGIGMSAVYYQGMGRLIRPGMLMPYDHVLGSAQLLVGADVMVSSSVGIGVRGAWLIPVINRPLEADVGNKAAPGFEEAAAMNTSFYRIMGSVSIAL